MATAEQRNHAKSFLKKPEEYRASAEDNLAGTKDRTPSWWHAAPVLCEREGAATEDGPSGHRSAQSHRNKSSHQS
jgi:hypothetical protein